MKNFPMFLRMAGRRVVVVGDGEQAAQKTRLMLKTEAGIEVVAPGPNAELEALAAQQRIRILADADVGEFEDTALVFIATGCKGADAAWHGIARDAGALVNVVDYPELCEAMTPSIVDRDPVVVAIGTEGTAPVLGRMIKTEIEGLLETGLGRLASLAGRLRPKVAHHVERSRHRAFWRWVFEGPPRALHANGDSQGSERSIMDAIAAGDAPDALHGPKITIIGGGSGSADLVTLRAVKRLQETDVLFCDKGTNPAILELARRDAERVFCNGADGTPWPVGRIVKRLREAASGTNRITWLVSDAADSRFQALAQQVPDAELIAGVTEAPTRPSPTRISA